MQYLDATSCNMRITIVGVLALSVFVGLCAAQCMMHQSQPSTHGKNTLNSFIQTSQGFVKLNKERRSKNPKKGKSFHNFGRSQVHVDAIENI